MVGTILVAADIRNSADTWNCAAILDSADFVNNADFVNSIAIPRRQHHRDDENGGMGAARAPGENPVDELVARARAAVSDAASTLARADVPDEALAEYTATRRTLGIARGPHMKPLGRAWRLGVFLLDRDGVLYAAGSTTRAVAPGRANHQSISGEARRAQRSAAHRARYAEGETVNFDARPIELDGEALAAASGPLFIAGDRALVRWNPTADATTAIEFEAYLRERLEFLLTPRHDGAAP